MTVVAWATAAECASITGTAPDEATLALAQAVIETHTNRTPAASAGMRTRDLTWLARAVAFQAAWLPSQPGYLSRSTAQSISQDGFSATWRSPSELTLAPLASRALKNCSWMGSRSVRFAARPARPADEPIEAGETSDTRWLQEGSDPDTGWEPLTAAAGD